MKEPVQELLSTERRGFLGSEAVQTVAARGELFTIDPGKLFADLKKSWEKFVSGTWQKGFEGVRNEVFTSWQRCVELNLDPRMPRAPRGLEPAEVAELVECDDFATTGSEVLRGFAHVVEANRHAIGLADADGRILFKIGDPRSMPGLHDAGATMGGLWSEQAIGPNGVGTALRTGRPCFIFGPEHFCESFHSWVCYASPVNDPVTGRTLGTVDIAGPALQLDRSALNLTQSLARSVERALVGAALERRYALAEEFLAAVGRWPGEGIVVSDQTGRIVHESPEALRILGEDCRSSGKPAYQSVFALARRCGIDVSVGRPLEGPNESSANGLSLHYNPLRLRGRWIGSLCIVRPTDGRYGASSRADSTAAPREPTGLNAFRAVLGTSAAIREAVRVAEVAARSERTVLLTGETGTGKELFAQAIHSASARRKGPFVAVNCAALPSELAESELFGYAPGTFTGGRREGSRGKFELAEHGTIFLDEIALMPLGLQAKLLRIVETRILSKLGDVPPKTLDVRIVAASNQDLCALAANGTFRLDLYYRLNVLQVKCPPLRGRREDVILLAHSFLDRECESLGRPPLILTPEVENALQGYSWPGNVRELQNVCARWAGMCPGPSVVMADLPSEISPQPSANSLGLSSGHSFREMNVEMNKQIILSALAQCDNNVSAAARQLGISRTTLYHKLRQAKSPT